MLPRSQRLNRDQVKIVLSQKARFLHTPLATVRWIQQKNPKISRFSVVVSKKIAKHAVDRNHIRRQIYSVVTALKPSIFNDYVIMVKNKGSYREWYDCLGQIFTQK